MDEICLPKTKFNGVHIETRVTTFSRPLNSQLAGQIARASKLLATPSTNFILFSAEAQSKASAVGGWYALKNWQANKSVTSSKKLYSAERERESDVALTYTVLSL